MKIGTGNAGGVSPSAVYSFSALPSYAISYVYEPVLAYENLPSGALTNSICQTTSDSTFWQFDGTSWIELGSSAALGDATIWQNALDWASLPTEDLRNGDRVLVQDLGQPSSYGFAEYDDTDWYLVQAFFLSEADLNEFTQLKKLGAIAYILDVSTVPDAQDGAGVVYYYNGAIWVRTPKDTAYIHPAVATVSDVLNITSPRDGDKVFVIDTGYETGGYAVYVAESNMWKLDQGWFPTVADMEAFATDPDTVRDYAIASVGAEGPAYPHYVFNEGTAAWIRTPDGAHYIWPQVNNWGLLTTDRPHAINNDEVHVHELNVSHSSGTAQLHGGTWKLIEGKWPSVTDMNGWTEGTIHTGAIAFIDSGHQYDQNSAVYYYTGSAWVATQPVGVTKVHTISSIYDFSASGLADGDYGVLTPSGGSPIVLRYKAACAIAAGGTRAVWMTPTAYAGSPVLQAWTDGTESNATLTSQGWAVILGSGCTITPTGGYQRMFAPGVNPVGATLVAMNGAIVNSTKVESIYECRASLPNGSACRSTQFLLADGVNGYSIGDSGQGGATGYGYRQGNSGPIVNTPIRDVTSVRIPSLAATPFVGVARDEGRTVFTSVLINGNAFADYRRSLANFAVSAFYVYAASDVTAPVTMDYRGQVLTY